MQSTEQRDATLRAAEIGSKTQSRTTLDEKRGGRRQTARSITPTPSRPSAGKRRGGCGGRRRPLWRWPVPWPGRTPRHPAAPRSQRTKKSRQQWNAASAGLFPARSIDPTPSRPSVGRIRKGRGGCRQPLTAVRRGLLRDACSGRRA
jgi:hypothetical protein